jgi:hypothetical protein
MNYTLCEESNRKEREAREDLKDFLCDLRVLSARKGITVQKEE